MKKENPKINNLIFPPQKLEDGEKLTPKASRSWEINENENQ